MSEREIMTPEAAMFEPREDLSRLRGKAQLTAIVGAVLLLVGFFVSEAESFFRAYLAGWLWILGIALGLFVVSMLNHLSGGRWGILLRRVSEASGRTLPFVALLGLPLVFGLEHLYSWVHPEVDASGHLVDHLLAHKQPYLNLPAFLIRAVVYFVIWSTLAYTLSAWSRRQDESGDPALRKKMQRLSAAGLILYILTATLASVDWIMSLDPHWFSSLFGVAFAAGHGLSAFASAVPIMLFLSLRKPLAGLADRRLFHDYGKLMLAFTMLWAYFMISQYLIIWSGNLPEEVTWYIARTAHGWQLLSMLLILGHFALPFIVLLSAEIKKRPRQLVWVAMWVLVMRWLDLYWQTAPSIGHHGEASGFHPHWLDPVAPVALGAIWLVLLIGQLAKRPLLPVRDPGLKEALPHG